MRHGSLEYDYAEPFAAALIADQALREWVLKRTKFSDTAGGARVLHEEMRAKRSKVATTWWRSHFSESCRCQGCSGQETDLLAIFERPDGTRFALHVEVKQPTDIFPARKDQAANYAYRAQCWASKPPKSVLPHDEADTILLCSETRLSDYAPHLSKFGGVITFEQLRRDFPHATKK